VAVCDLVEPPRSPIRLHIMTTFTRQPIGIALLLTTLAASVILVAGCAQLLAQDSAPSSRTSIQQMAAPDSSAPESSVVVIATPPSQVAVAPAAEAAAPATLALPTVTPTAVPTATPAPLHQPAQAAVHLAGLSHFWQTWNNCGPATLAMNLSYYGGAFDQTMIGNVLRTHEDDKNVMPEELAAYAQGQGYRAEVRVGGNPDLVRTLLTNGIPVLIETWLEEHPNDGMGHYRLLVGYDDAAQTWIAYDSYARSPQVNPNGTYSGIYMPYGQMAEWWKVFNHTYVLIYPEAQAPLVASILGEQYDPTVMWARAYEAAQLAVSQQPGDAFAWFNLGTDLVHYGDYAGAAAAYDQARTIGLPWRMLWYQFGPFEAYHAVGRYDDVIALADATINVTPSIEETHYWRGKALAAQGNVEAARTAWQRALAQNPNFAPALEALATEG
jgi:hypothetical protein